MSSLTNANREKYLEKVKHLRLIDDIFFNICFDDNIKCMNLLLRIVLNNKNISVIKVTTQRTMTNLYGRGVRFDVLATDGKQFFECEVQRSDEGANPRRTRFHVSMIDSREVAKGTKFKDLPEIYVIFITENDVWGNGLPLYHVKKTITENGMTFDDGTHTMYVNGAYRDDSDIGKLMHDFFCEDPDDMYFDDLKNTAKIFKGTEGGQNTMCKAIEDLVVAERAESEAKGRAEGRAEGKKETRIESIKNIMRNFNVTAEKAMQALEIPADERAIYLPLILN
ncbi:MAG: PD-(D/E)XK nuclease family transposase [Selenomonadaceae bacterium]